MVHVGADHALARLPAGALRRRGHALLPQPVDRLVEVVLAGRQGLLAVHDAGPGLVPELADALCRRGHQEPAGSGSAAARLHHGHLTRHDGLGRLGRGRLRGLAAALAHRAPALDQRVGDPRGDQANGADRVVVAGNRVGDARRIAVGVDDGDDGNRELLRLGDGDALLARIDDEDRRRQAVQLLDADQRFLQLGPLPVQPERFLLGEPVDLARLAHLVQALEVVDRLADRREVREGPAEPALVDVEHAAAGGFLGDRVLRLLLGADEQHRAALGGQVAGEEIRLAELLERLLQVDDVDAVALPEDVLGHLRVPALGLVAEVDAGLQQLLHGDLGHRASLLGFRLRAPGCRPASLAGPGRHRCRGRVRV